MHDSCTYTFIQQIFIYKASVLGIEVYAGAQSLA